MADKNVAEVVKPKTIPTWLNFVIGGTAGMMAIAIVQPMDLLKTRMQLLGAEAKNTSLGAVASGIMKKEGIGGFYHGLSAALFRQATYTTGRLGSFNGIFDIYKDAYGQPSFPEKVGIGMVAGGIGAFIGTPAEVVLIRMTADGRLPPDKRRNYTNVFNALGRITREEGITTLWRGVAATVTRAIVVNGAQLGSYTQARQMLMPHLSDGLPLHTAAAMIAGFITSVVSMPLDIVKTRVQNSAAGASQFGVLMSVIQKEGILALWSGLLPTYAKIGPHTVFCFIFLEQLNNLYFSHGYKYFWVLLAISAFSTSWGQPPDMCDCPTIQDPVCGTDLITYRNLCQLECAIIQRSNWVDLRKQHDGECYPWERPGFTYIIIRDVDDA